MNLNDRPDPRSGPTTKGTKSSQEPLVSVIMTVYNGERYLAEAVESILGQTLTNLELVVVDDASDDSTPDILENYKVDSRVRVVSRPRIGRARALNVAWKNAKAAFVANLDADDYALPRRLERQLEFLENHPKVDLLGTACRIVDLDSGRERESRPFLEDRELKRQLVRGNPFVHSSVMMRRKALQKVGGYDESLKIAIDYDLWVRMAKVHEVANLPETLTVKRVYRSAYFKSRSKEWRRLCTRLRIRWRAWRAFSRSIRDLHHALVRPVLTWGRLRLVGERNVFSGQAKASRDPEAIEGNSRKLS